MPSGRQARPGLTSPFRHPEGFVGRMAGRLMAVEHRRQYEAALTRLRAKPGERILELGCGAGLGLRMLGGLQGVFAAGVDESPDMARLASANAGRECAIQADADVLPFPDATFQGVFAVRMADSWPHPQAALAEARRVLARGGRILLAERGGADPGSWDAQADGLETLLEDAGFEGVRAEIGAGRRPVLLGFGWRA